MGFFKTIKNRLYWNKHQDEKVRLETEGNELLAEFNTLIYKMNVCPDVSGYSIIRNRLLEILDWFEDLDKRGCPYHLIGGANKKRQEIARTFNNGLNFAIKRCPQDFELAINLLIPAENYAQSKNAIQQQQKNNNSYFIGTGTRFLSILENHFKQDNIISETLIACGIPQEIVLSRNIEEINKYKPIFETQTQKDDFNAYAIALKQRYAYAHLPLFDQSQRAENINLRKNEIVYTRINCVTLHKETIVGRNVNYGGLRWQFGLVRGGNISYTTNVIKHFTVQDIGSLYITNERLLYIGSQKHLTVTIPISSVISYDLFKDGVLLRIANNPNAVLLKFEPIDRFNGMLVLQDGMNTFISIIERIIQGTTDIEI